MLSGNNVIHAMMYATSRQIHFPQKQTRRDGRVDKAGRQKNIRKEINEAHLLEPKPLLIPLILRLPLPLHPPLLAIEFARLLVDDARSSPSASRHVLLDLPFLVPVAAPLVPRDDDGAERDVDDAYEDDSGHYANGVP